MAAEELGAIIALSIRAFFDDPFIAYLLPEDALRRSRLPIFFRSLFTHLGEHGRIVTVRDERDAVLGVAAWLTTGGYPLPVSLQLRQMPSATRALYRRPRKLLSSNRYVAALARAHRKDPHWYLLELCADPPLQRSGVGTMLLEHALAQVDAEGVGSHLETPRQDNLAYYRRFGYELTETLNPVDGGPTYYSMWRAPREPI